MIAYKTNIVGHGHSHIKGSQKDQPIPACFEGAEVEKNELGFLGISDFIFRQSGWIPKHVLERERTICGSEHVFLALFTPGFNMQSGFVFDKGDTLLFTPDVYMRLLSTFGKSVCEFEF